MRIRKWALLMAMGASSAGAQPAETAGSLRFDGIDGEGVRKSNGACAALADEKHDKWIDLLSMGGGFAPQSQSEKHHFTITLQDATVGNVLDTMVACGGKYVLSVRNKGRKYRIYGATIRPASRQASRYGKSFVVTYTAIRRGR